MSLRFSKNAQLDFETRIALGAVAYGAGDTGEILATVDAIGGSDYEAWFQGWKATGERVLAIAEACEAAGRLESARSAYLRAAAYLYASTSSLDGTDDPSRGLEVWRAHRRAWERWCALCDPPVERIAIPYESTELVGYVFRPAAAADRERLPTIVLNNGSDGPVHSMWLYGGAAAVERGYLAVTFDGPGQGHALYEQGLFFRPDWEAVIAPVVDFLLERPDVDPDRIALHGVSQGGYWVPRAVAFERRIAAAVADPGAMDVATSWLSHLPKSMVKALDGGNRKSFDRQLKLGTVVSKEARFQLAFRMRPYGIEDPYDCYHAVLEYNLRDVVDRIECPLLVTDPDDEQFWPGQSQELYDALDCPKTLVRFTAEEGAAGHCEPMALRLRDQRVFDWLDETLRRQAA